MKDELDKYGDRLKSLVDAEVNATPAMRAYGLRVQPRRGGLSRAVATAAVPVADTVRMALNSKAAGETVRKMFNVDGKAKASHRSLRCLRRWTRACAGA